MSDQEKIYQFHTQRTIEFADTDMSGIVHFSRFFAFMETAEHEFLRSLGTSVHTTVDGRSIGWPRVAASCEYINPARFEETLDITVTVLRKGRSAVTYGFDFSRDGQVIASGRMTSVCCVLDDPEGLYSIPMPSPQKDRLTTAPEG